MSARWWTAGVWALAAGSAVFWGFRVLVQPAAVPALAQAAAPTPAPRGDLARLLGNDPPPVATAAEPEAAADARFQLVGVVSPRSSQAAREGLALIAVDGGPPKAFRVGAVVDGANVLQSVAPRGATLGPRGGVALVALNLAPPAAPATGQLPPAAGAFPPPGLPAGAGPGALRRAPGAGPAGNAVRRPGQPAATEAEAQETVVMPNQVDNQPTR